MAAVYDCNIGADCGPKAAAMYLPFKMAVDVVKRRRRY
jgi:hypothetical protein